MTVSIIGSRNLRRRQTMRQIKMSIYQRQRKNDLLTERIIYRKRQIRIKDPLMKLLRTWVNENILES